MRRTLPIAVLAALSSALPAGAQTIYPLDRAEILAVRVEQVLAVLNAASVPVGRIYTAADIAAVRCSAAKR